MRKYFYTELLNFFPSMQSNIYEYASKMLLPNYVLYIKFYCTREISHFSQFVTLITKDMEESVQNFGKVDYHVDVGHRIQNIDLKNMTDRNRIVTMMNASDALTR